MKKIIFKFALSLLTAFSVCWLSIVAITSKNTVQVTPKAEAQTTLEHYTVKEHLGKIAVFHGNNAKPLYILDNPYVRDLPEYDQALLKQGIVAKNNTELLQILEDYDN